MLEGKVFKMLDGGHFQIVDANDDQDVWVVSHQTGLIFKVGLKVLECGEFVEKPTSLSKLNYKDKEISRIHNIWTGIINRSMNPAVKQKHPSYEDVKLHKDWYVFEDFYSWYISQKGFNIKDNKGRYYSVDKDLLISGNKVYSPETCCLLPNEINCLIKGNFRKGSSLPKGVFANKRGNFYSTINLFGKRVYLGAYVTAEEAFVAYKKARESHLRVLSHLYVGLVDDKVIKALRDYKIKAEYM